MDFSDEVRKVAENVAVNPTKDMENLTTLYGTDKNLEPYSPMKMYEKIGGEAEARLTEARMDMTDAERAQNFPYEYTPRRLDENLQPTPITGLDVRLEDQIIHGHKPNTIDIGGKRIFGTPDQATPESVELPQSKIDELGFNSPLENAILKIGQPKGTGDQFLKQLEKMPGVKTEELEVTGVKRFLEDSPTVTKQELQDYIANNRVKLENKILNETGVDDIEDYQLRGGEVYHDDDYINSMADDLHYDMKNDPVIRDQERQALLEADPERYADYDTNPYSQARLEEDIDGVLFENAKQQANDMYYENPISHYYDDFGYDIYGNDEMGYSFKDPSGGFLDIGGRNGTYNLSDAEAALRDYHFETGNLGANEGAPKYEDYTLPGNYTNYREVLTTLPSQSDFDKASMNMFEFRKAVNKRLDKPTGGWDYEELTPQEQMKYDILNERMLRASKNKTNYESSHFDEPNILAHTRLNDRIINGKKTLMVEEIQSDWHQAGRRKGYDTGVSVPQYTIETDPNGVFRIKDINNERFEPFVDGDRLSGFMTKEAAENAMQANMYRLPKKRGGGEVPDAPFKKNWHELMMKQILNEAVKGDYDAVAFTTGKQQAERYSLSKQINELRAEKLLSGTKEGQYVITATNKNGNPSVNKTVTEQELENLLGKDLAKKIVEDSPDNPDGKTYSGLDLDVGGEGMKGFYDKILPDYINKYGKKYGIGVKKANLEHPTGIFKQEEIEKILKDNNLTKEEFNKLSAKEKNIIWQSASKGEEVHYFDLSDMAKKDIKEKGQPLFSGIGLAPAPLLFDEEDN